MHGSYAQNPGFDSPAQQKLGTVLHACAPRIQEVEQGDWWFKDILGYIVSWRLTWDTGAHDSKRKRLILLDDACTLLTIALNISDFAQRGSTQALCKH